MRSYDPAYLDEPRHQPAPDRRSGSSQRPGSDLYRDADRRGGLRGRDGWQRPRPDPDDDDPEPRRGYLAALVLTVAWYGVPILLYLVWTLTLGGTAEAGCVDPAGQACDAPRAEAQQALIGGLSQIVTALGLSVLLAIALRWGVRSWRALTVGFASAVVGAGVATVIFSVIGGGAPL